MTLHVLPYPPSVNHYWRMIVKGKRAIPILSREAREYKQSMASHAAGHQPSQDPVCLTIRLYRPRKAGDIDGPLKPLLDALQGFLYVNDSQIVEMHVYRLDDKEAPRVEVEVSPRDASTPASS